MNQGRLVSPWSRQYNRTTSDNCLDGADPSLSWLYAGGLSVSIVGPSDVQLKYIDNNDGKYSVSYLPTKAGKYKIVIKFAEDHIAGSPFTAEITDDGMQCIMFIRPICETAQFVN